MELAKGRNPAGRRVFRFRISDFSWSKSAFSNPDSEIDELPYRSGFCACSSSPFISSDFAFSRRASMRNGRAIA